MIDSKDLRIGNWVLDPDGSPLLLTEKELAFLLTNDFQQLGCDPIAISPDILEKCGIKFSHESNEYAHYKLPNNFYISLCKKDWPDAFKGKAGHWYTGENHTEITSLHHLQNYCYIVHGFELTINL